MVFPLANLYTFIDAITSLEIFDRESDDWDGGDDDDDDESDDGESRRIRTKRKASLSSWRRPSRRVKRRGASRDFRPRYSKCSSDSSELSNCPGPASTASSTLTEDKMLYSTGGQVGGYCSVQHRDQQVDSERKMDLEAKTSLHALPTTSKKPRRFGLPFRRGGSRRPKENKSWSGKSVTVGLFTGPY